MGGNQVLLSWNLHRDLAGIPVDVALTPWGTNALKATHGTTSEATSHWTWPIAITWGSIRAGWGTTEYHGGHDCRDNRFRNGQHTGGRLDHYFWWWKLARSWEVGSRCQTKSAWWPSTNGSSKATVTISTPTREAGSTSARPKSDVWEGPWHGVAWVETSHGEVMEVGCNKAWKPEMKRSRGHETQLSYFVFWSKLHTCTVAALSVGTPWLEKYVRSIFDSFWRYHQSLEDIFMLACNWLGLKLLQSQSSSRYLILASSCREGTSWRDVIFTT